MIDHTSEDDLITFSNVDYAAIIRAYEFSPLLEEVVSSLKRQTRPPKKIIIVDSSNNPETSRHFCAIADVVLYPDTDFNFSRAINVGVDNNPFTLTMIISSHTLINKRDLVEKGLIKLSSCSLEIMYMTPKTDGCGHLETLINAHNFDGSNGIHNSLSIIPTHLLKRRPFREEVFSAEDQEWTKYYLEHHKRSILRFETEGICYLNPNHGDNSWNETKLLNEELAIGYFVNKKLLRFHRVFFRFSRSIIAFIRGRPSRARIHFRHALALLKANFWMPRGQSRYF